MKKFLLLLLPVFGGFAPAALAQTTPVQTVPPVSTDKDPVWLIFDQPLPPEDSSKPKPGGRGGTPKAYKTEKAEKAEVPAAKPTTAAPAPAVQYSGKTTQGSTYVPLDQDVYRLIDRYAIKYGPDSLSDPHTSVRPYTRASVARLASRYRGPGFISTQPNSEAPEHTGVLVIDGKNLSAADKFNLDYLARDNWEYTAAAAAVNTSQRPFLKYFYTNQSDLFHVDTPDFTLRVNPVAGLQAGYDNQLSGLRYLNTRGLQVEGTIDGRLGFYTFLADNQMAVPGYVQNRIQRDSIIPHETFLKNFKGKADQYDFFSARGYLTYAATKHINVQLGHDRNIIGNGYRSLILSDYSAPYFFLKLNTRIWRFNYQNLFAELNANAIGTNQVYPKKYLALHHLSLDVTSNFNVGVFESIMFARGKGRLELQYLNPIIFYRSIEQQVGSADNALLGADFKWNIKHRGQIYGQLMLDEFVISEVRAGNGWQGNRQAFQLGAKYLDVAGIRNLDLQAEFNYVRPYTYEHTSQYTSYQQYRQPLAHPMGANLYEIIGIVSYQPLPRLNLVAKAFYSEQGLDTGTGTLPEPNYGSNVLKPYTTRVSEYGNQVGQGNTTHLLHGDLTATYQVKHNLWLDAKQILRHQSSNTPVAGNGTEAFSSLTVRWNLPQRLNEF